ncbi:lipase family protein [Skermania sp. ID1734]|uniref:lipase family protein n=1 Tax=Skermania sp. ID1734 TaxID=2597516 RepID=UPI00117DCA2B|nr:lipase family protein [Skermania sp. ID1734]TSD97257.1 lipase family protein [Skermania sp. ID1734]
MAFDALFARDVALPLAKAAYDAMTNATPGLPAGYEQTGLIETGDVPATMHPVAATMAAESQTFGLLGANRATATAFLAFRGSRNLEDWLRDLDAVPDLYRPVHDFGQVHLGFQSAYLLVRASIIAGLPRACEGCNRLILTGHSLGAALAVLCAPDIVRNMPPNTLEPRLITFAGPRVGLSDFALQFNAMIESCFRVVNFLDIVPYLPPEPFVHVGAAIDVDSGGSVLPSWRHNLAAYAVGLTNWISAHPNGP